MGALARGTIYFILVQLVFLGSGYAIQAGLGRMLGPQLYGTFGVVIALVTMFNLILISGLPQAASRYIAMNNESAGAIKKIADRTMAVFALIIFLLYFFLADVVASLLRDPGLTIYIRLSSFIIPIYAFYSLYSGYLNGLRDYGKQAKAAFVYNIAKVIGVFALVLLEFSVAGAIAGFALAPLAGLLVAWCYFKPERNENAFEKNGLVNFAIPVIISSVAFTGLMSLDLFFVKRVLAGDEVGYYTAASNISRLPFYTLTAMGGSLFPAIAACKDRVQIERYLIGIMKYLLILLFLIVVLISATSEALVTLLYSSTYIPAALPLDILIFGLGFLTLFSILTTAITATGRARVSMFFSVALVMIAFAANAALVPVYGLNGAAIATTLTGFLGFIMTLIFARRIVGKIAELKSVFRASAASAIIFVLIPRIHTSPTLLPLLYITMSIVYFGILVAMKDIGIEDLKKLRESYETRADFRA